MRRPIRVCAGMLAAVSGTLVLTAAPAAAQPAPGAAQVSGGSYVPSRTSWGHPDLQGIWTTDAERSVPVERPEQYGDRATLTPEELGARADSEAREARDDPKERRTRPGDPGAGPEHWYERGEKPSPRTSLVIDPPNGRIPPLTEAALRRKVDPRTVLGFVPGVGSMGDGPFDGPEDFHLADRCITRGLPQTWFPSAYNNGFQIVQSPGSVAILYERLHEHRIVPLQPRPQLSSDIRQWIGDSRGYWDGDTLVVQVTNFSDRTNFRGSGAALRLTERYTRVDEGTIKVEITVDDPSTWIRPWTVAVTGKRDPAYWQIFEYACHEGNYGMKHILSAARAAEKQAGTATAPKDR